MLEKFPKTFTLKDGTSLTLRPVTRDDENDIARFFSSLPDDSRRYLRNDVTDRKIIARWMRELDYEKTLPLVAEGEGKIAGTATLHRQTFGWGRHVGEVRVVIGPAFQGRGLGSLLLNEICLIGAENGLKKLVARIITARAEVIRAFEKSGFQNVAVLEKYVKDVDKNYADIAILVKELAPGSSGCQ